MREKREVIILGGRMHGGVIKHEPYYAIALPRIAENSVEVFHYPIEQFRLCEKTLYIATNPDLVAKTGALMQLLLKPEWFEHWKAAPRR